MSDLTPKSFRTLLESIDANVTFEDTYKPLNEGVDLDRVFSQFSRKELIDWAQGRNQDEAIGDALLDALGKWEDGSGRMYERMHELYGDDALAYATEAHNESSVDEGRALTEESDDLREAGAELEQIWEQMANLVEQATDIMRSVRSDPAGEMAYRRADNYWLSHIKGALGGQYESGSMVTMEDTINELLSDEEDEY